MGRLQLLSSIKYLHLPSKVSYSSSALSFSTLSQLRGTCASVRGSKAYNWINKTCASSKYITLLPTQYDREYTTSNYKTIVQKNIPLQAKKRVQKKKGPVSVDTADKDRYVAVAYSSAEGYNIKAISTAIDEQGLYKQLPLPDDVDDVLHVTAKYQVDTEPRHMYFFSDGSVVFWNVPNIEQKSVLKFLKLHEIHSYDENLVTEEQEDLEYYYTDTETKLSKGRIFLKAKEDNPLEAFAFSNALAHSVKLALWEASLDSYMDSIEYLAEDMREGKETKLSRSQLFKKRGELFTLRHCINFSDLMDTPDFYWDRDTLEKIYKDTCNHLDVPKRIKVMNERLTCCSEFIDLLSNHFTDKHHIGLERMIIALIMVEVVLGFADLMK